MAAPPIDIFPATPNTLVQAIKDANEQNRTIRLHPGTFFTVPGRGKRHKTKIGANGLRIKGFGAMQTKPLIKRPDNSIDIDHPDENYGLFFIPEHATDAEFASISSWKEGVTKNGKPISYAVILRGTIEITDVAIDCNMGRQHLQEIYDAEPDSEKRPAEHSCMIGFSGTETTRKTGEYAGKTIYIGFNKVLIKNVHLVNGGYADDIRIGRGYFNPNIVEVNISNISSGPRIDHHRATVGFSGLVEKAIIQKANIYCLECEETSSRWDELPRKDEVYKTSYWKLDDIVADRIDLAAKGKAIYMMAKNLVANVKCNLYQVGGQIKNCTFVKGTDPHLNRLSYTVFTNVIWIFEADEDGFIKGIKPVAQYGEECTAFFMSNEFKVKGSFSKGALINSNYSSTLPGNIVFLNFHNCKYDSRFGSSAYPNTNIISAMER